MKIKRGDQFSTLVKFKNSDGTGVDLTGCTVFFTVRNTKSPISVDDSDAMISKILTLVDAENGIAGLSLTSTDTSQTAGSYYWELQVKFSSGDILSTQTGSFEIVPDLTKRTS